MTIAIIHFVLGNVNRAKVWLSEELSEKGWVEMPVSSLELLGFNKIEDFFNAIFQDNGKEYKRLTDAIKYNRDEINNSRSVGFGSGGDFDY